MLAADLTAKCAHTYTHTKTHTTNVELLGGEELHSSVTSEMTGLVS